MLVKVKDNESGREMPITKRAYELRKHKYTFLKYVDDNGNDLPSPNQKPQPQIQPAQSAEQESDVVPAESEVVEKKKRGPKPKNQISSQVESVEV